MVHFLVVDQGQAYETLASNSNNRLSTTIAWDFQKLRGLEPYRTFETPNPDAAVVNRQIDPSLPYYLGSNNNPGNVISAIKLTGSNYEEWSRSLRLSLRGRRKFGFVDGTLTKSMNPDFVVD
ncbi:hypothetical protein LIER_13728 [Lithospermum erythrorhizon]|uniref:Retrotransposon Copia-like N-terminal domain-containing protein n=1 Tax=Lithospermum erythrorhizon TaxID=34254 RepID=A0AAV3PWY3_LITER